MRSIKELLQVMLDNENLFRYGLCGVASELYTYAQISFEENRELMHYLEENLPKDRYMSDLGLRYHFPVSEWQPRKEWLEKQIESFKNIES